MKKPVLPVPPILVVGRFGFPVVVIEYTTDPELIFEKWQHLVDGVIDGGFGDNYASTIIDLTAQEPVVIREGKGSLDIL